MPLTDVEICSAALIKLGAAPIASLAEPRTEAEVARRLYPIARDALLSAHPWAFTQAQALLVASGPDPLGDFQRSFALPADFLRATSAGIAGRGRGTAYRIAGGRLHADPSELLLSYQRRAGEAEFPAHFTAALVARLAAEFCLPVTENAGRAEVLYRLAAAESQLARLIDSQQATPRAVEDFSLIAARRS
jgi:hypothetical protein